MGTGDQGGFDLDRFTTNSIVQFNYSHDNDGWGYMIGSNGVNDKQMPPENNIFRFNVSMNDCRNSSWGALNFENWSASTVYVYNNTFYMSDNPVTARPPVIGFGIDDKNIPGTPPTLYLYNNIFFASSTTVPMIDVRDNDLGYFAPVGNVKFLRNDYFSKGGSVAINWAPSSTFRDPGMVTENPTLGSERLSMAPRITQIDNMAGELSPFFTLNGTKQLREGGVDLSAQIGTNWWTPDNFNWNGKLGLPRDFFGVAVPTKGLFSIGASESTK
jgi:hypothetical protein